VRRRGSWRTRISYDSTVGIGEDAAGCYGAGGGNAGFQSGKFGGVDLSGILSFEPYGARPGLFVTRQARDVSAV